MIIFLINLIQLLSRLIFIVIIVDVLLSYFLPPYHSVRMFLDRIVEPMLRPIRRVVPPLQMIDFSPVILIILVQIVEYILVRLLISLR
ncbi:MAG: YggT family protein [Chloroflexi bacterium]|jgi:YggT family protein|nr:YggT family protein [Anaerolineaceae bacterium]NMB88807.1 YggT family protein [Chloroflexota bacterium]